MAKEYYEKLTNLLNVLDIGNEIAQPMEVKHFFGGAALYVNKSMCASWSPVGLAFKLPGREARQLIDSGKALPLKYFPQGHVKKGYALFKNPDDQMSRQWKKYFMAAAQQ